MHASLAKFGVALRFLLLNFGQPRGRVSFFLLAKSSQLHYSTRAHIDGKGFEQRETTNRTVFIIILNPCSKDIGKSEIVKHKKNN